MISTADVLRETPPGVGDDRGSVRVTFHAQLRYLGRVNAIEEYPKAAIRRAWRESESVAGHPNARDGRGLRLIYDVYDGVTTILTVYEHSEVGGPE